MLIVLNVQGLLKDIKSKSHYDVSSVTDAEARYRIEAGTEKEDEILRTMAEVATSLSRRLRRFLESGYQMIASDRVSLPEDFTWELDISERRANNLMQPLADAAHSYIVHYTLAKFYSTVSAVELSNIHSTWTAEAAEAIDELIYSKQEPPV